MNRKMLLVLVLGLIILPSLITACAEPEEVEVTRIVTEEVETIVEVEVEVTRIVTEIQEIEVTRVVPLEMDDLSFVSLASMAKRIRDGEIEIGNEFGMGEDQRFHVIHTDIIDMKCLQCHVEDAPLEVAAPLNITDEAPGIVDRRVCLGCHLNGPASNLYEPKE